MQNDLEECDLWCMMDALIKKVINGFSRIVDHRSGNSTYTLKDLLSAGFAIFSLKDPSLLAFRESYPYRSDNLKRLYHIENIPADTALREGLDGVEPSDLQQQFVPLLDELRQDDVLQSRQVLGGYLVIAADGTQHFCSGKKSCPHCMVKTYRGEGNSYYHQLLAGVLVHPEQKTVFPVAAEPIVRQDGAVKNDCEINAAKRLIPLIRQMLPEEKLLLTFDALYGNGPFIKLLAAHSMRFIMVVKEGYVCIQVEQLRKQGKLQELSWRKGKVQCNIRFANGLILNGQHQDTLVNYIEYEETDPSLPQEFPQGSLVALDEWMSFDILARRANTRPV